MAHPLDIELLDAVEGRGDPHVKAHVADCRWCRHKMANMVRHYMDVDMLDERE